MFQKCIHNINSFCELPCFHNENRIIVQNANKTTRTTKGSTSLAKLHLSVEQVQTFRTPTSGIVSFAQVPFGTLDEIEHILRVYL